MSCDTKTPYAGDDEILPHKKGKFVIGKLKSSLLSYIFVDKFPLLSVSRSKSKYEVELCSSNFFSVINDLFTLYSTIPHS